MIRQILNSYALNLKFLRGLVADLNEKQMVQQRQGVVNHPAWTIGHLIYSAQAVSGEIGMRPWLPVDWAKRFGTGSIPVSDPSAYPDKETLVHALDDAEKRLAAALPAMKASILVQPLPDARYRDRLPTVGDALLHILASHTAMHVGQITVWRRALGLEVVREPLNDSD